MLSNLGNLIVFLGAFLVGVLWFRMFFLLFPGYFIQPFLRRHTHLKWHHWHYAVFIQLIGVAILLFFGPNPVVYIFFGLGIGFLIDLYIPSLYLSLKREEGLQLYKDSYTSTFFLAGVIAFCFILLFTLLNK